MSRVYFRITIPEGFKRVFWRFCFGLLLVLAVVSGVPVEAKADETIQAEKVDPSSLKEGDQFLIVYGDYLALSKNPYNTKYVAPVALSVRSTATRQVLTEIPGEAAIFR